LLPAKGQEALMIMKTLYIGNLPASTTDMDLRMRFERFGTVESAIVVRDAQTGRSKRCGFVKMGSSTEARAAIDRLNMTQYEEAVISVSEARAEQQAR
jgi:RNA recognition motif-containing protein